jgi:UDP-N-acetylglucosamine/UDP-N-acetylgalactosamine diphosphorylase
MMTKEKAKIYLKSINQDHLLSLWDEWNEEKRANFLKQIEFISKIYKKDVPKAKLDYSKEKIEPVNNIENIEDQNEKIATESIAKGKIGCMILAGGMGSRFGLNNSKGLYPLTIIKKKSIFEILCNKILSAEKKYGVKIPLAIMVSPINEKEIKDFFEKKNYFSLDKDQIVFFKQTLLPFLDKNHKWFFEEEAKIAMAPNGNACFYECFYKNGFDLFKKLGIEYINVIPIDNPLADPINERLLSFHIKNKYRASAIAVKRNEENKRVGLFAKINKKIGVIEYFIAPEKLFSKMKNQDFEYLFANINSFCFSMDFIKKIIDKKLDFPTYVVNKKAKAFINGKEELVQAQKQESLFFDAFSYFDNIGIIKDIKENTYAPLKNFDGKNGVEEVQMAILEKDRKVFQQLFSVDVNDRIFELSQDFYYPTSELVKKWQGREFENNSYVQGLEKE